MNASKAAMELAEAICALSVRALQETRRPGAVEIAALIDAHPQVKALLEFASEYADHEQGGCLRASGGPSYRCTCGFERVSKVLIAWKPDSPLTAGAKSET